MGRETGPLSEVVEAARKLQDRGPGIVVVTSIVATDAPDGLLRMLAVDVDRAWLVETPMLDRSFTGSGDLTAAMFLAHSDGRGSFGVCKVSAWGVAFLHIGWRTACSKGFGECPSVFDRFLAKKEWLSFDVNQTFLGLS